MDNTVVDEVKAITFRDPGNTARLKNALETLNTMLRNESYVRETHFQLANSFMLLKEYLTVTALEDLANLNVSNVGNAIGFLNGVFAEVRTTAGNHEYMVELVKALSADLEQVKSELNA